MQRVTLLLAAALVVGGCASDRSATGTTTASDGSTTSTTSIEIPTTSTEVPTTEFPTTSTTGTASSTTTTAPPAFVLAPPADPTGVVTHESITVDGIERTYRLYVPRSLPSGPRPLVIALHGGTGWGDQFAQTDHVESLAESNGFVVVHPDGIKVAGGPGGAWNGGACCGKPARDGTDDVAFIRALIDAQEARFDIDPSRVVAFGHSNGAIMSYRLACELSDRITAIGMWAGALEIDNCTPAQPVSVIHGHGDADRNIPITGGAGDLSIANVDFNVPHDGFATLADADGCPAGSTSTSGDVTIESRRPCEDTTAAEFVTIHGANHSWPGGTPLRTPSTGPGYAGWDATAEIVTFLLGHPRPTP